MVGGWLKLVDKGGFAGHVVEATKRTMLGWWAMLNGAF